MNFDSEKWKSEHVEEWLKTLLSSIPDMILFKDGEGRWRFASDYTLSLFGLENSSYIGKTSAELSQLTPIAPYREILRSREQAEEKAWTSKSMTRSEVEFPLVHGRTVILDVIVCPIFSTDGQRRALVVIGRDITERKEAEERVHQLAYYDQLSNLPNRYRFEQELENHIVISHSLQQSFVLMLIDIDRFQHINNSLGPAVGDQLIILIAERLKQSVQGTGFLAHMGGDKYALLIPNIFGWERPTELARNIIEVIKEPFSIHPYELFLTTTIGLCAYPQDGEDVQTLMKHADVALSLAKEQGKNRFLLYNSTMDVATFKLFSLENSLNKALANQEFEIYYQPKIELATNRIIGAEALIRWNHPEWHLVSPKEFIPLAEETGLIYPIGKWVIQTVCRQLKEWQEAGIKTVPVSVNSTAKQFMDKEFVTTISSILDETGLDPCDLEIEITESTLMDNEEYAIDVIHRLRDLGISVSLDDFGTGFSALSYLKRFDVDAIKLDRSFIKDVGIDEKVTMIVKGLIHLIKSLNIKVVAEGVETKEQLRFLNDYECDHLQGFLYCRPVKAEEYVELLSKEYISLENNQKRAENWVNKRKYYRIHLSYPLLAEMTILRFMGRDVDLGKSEVLVWDVGLGGLGFASNIKLPVRPDMTLSIKTKILGETMDFVGRVVWSKEVEEEIYRYGMEFLIDEEEREAIAKVFNQFMVKLRKNPILPDCEFIAIKTNSYLKKDKQAI